MYTRQALVGLRHVSARHRWRHKGVHSVAGQRPQNGPLHSKWVKTWSHTCPHTKISVKILECPQHKY